MVHGRLRQGTGAYDFHVHDVPQDQLIKASIEDEVDGTIGHKGEQHRHILSLSASQAVFIAGSTEEACERGNVVYEVQGPNDSAVHDACDDIGEFTASEAGEYTIVVKGRLNRGTGTYGIAIEPEGNWDVNEILVDRPTEVELHHPGISVSLFPHTTTQTRTWVPATTGTHNGLKFLLALRGELLELPP